jgi:hypothetical protein
MLTRGSWRALRVGVIEMVEACVVIRPICPFTPESSFPGPSMVEVLEWVGQELLLV